MIGIIDCDTGNLLSVRNALYYLGCDSVLCRKPEDLEGIDNIILPGVGAFADFMNKLRSRGFIDSLEKAVFDREIPILGICLGMQVMARKSFEGGVHSGLGWIDGDVVRLRPADLELHVPHIGWNDVLYRSGSTLFHSMPLSPNFYFVHSYHLQCDDEDIIEATCSYGMTITASIRKRNIFATQFHPEKSQDHGLMLLKNFLQWNENRC